MNYRITDEITKEDKEAVFEELLKYNLEHIENTDVKDIGIFLEDPQGEKIAALIGDTHGNWLEIEYLWVNKDKRGNNIGRDIIERAELLAKQRGCKYAFVNTFHFQAPGFYEKLGYKEVFVLNNYPSTGKRHYYMKEL